MDASSPSRGGLGYGVCFSLRILEDLMEIRNVTSDTQS